MLSTTRVLSLQLDCGEPSVHIRDSEREKQALMGFQELQFERSAILLLVWFKYSSGQVWYAEHFGCSGFTAVNTPLLNAVIHLWVIYSVCHGSRCGQRALCFSFPSLEPLTHTACSCQPLLMYTLNFLSNLWSISAVSYTVRLSCSRFAFVFNEALFCYQ